MESIIQYLREKYRPVAIVVYGSYADGTNNAHSDFDALVIAEDTPKLRDISTVGGIKLDVFVYPKSAFLNTDSYEDFVQLYDGIVVLDTDGFAATQKAAVRAYIDNKPPRSREDLRIDLAWCEKMLCRAQRHDAEGDYRLHWLLIDSLEIYYQLLRKPYFGPKKSILKMQKEDPESAALYAKALKEFSQETAAAWVACLQRLYCKL